MHRRATRRHPGGSTLRATDHPVVSITWEDAKAYCDWFSKAHGQVVRLASEAEWEYAARGGLRGRRYPNGDSMSPREANYASSGAVKVATYAPNGYGLYDMAGNVAEWVADSVRPSVLPRLAGQEPARSGSYGQRTAAARRSGWRVVPGRRKGSCRRSTCWSRVVGPGWHS